jgi:hypothetical protein
VKPSFVYRRFCERTNPAEKKLRKHLFRQNNLAIINDPCFKKEFGRYPVIFLNLSVSKFTIVHFIEVDLNCNHIKIVFGLTMKQLKKEFKNRIYAIFAELEVPATLNHQMP